MVTRWHGMLGLILVAGIVAGCATAGRPGKIGSKPAPRSITPEAVIAAEEELASMLGAPADDVEYLAFQKVEWPDGCLGMVVPGLICEGQPTLGWWVVLMAQGEQFRFRTDLNGHVVRAEE